MWKMTKQLIEYTKNIFSKLKKTCDNYSFKDILKHSFFKSSLIFEVITADRNILLVPYAVLKQDHPCDCANHVSSFLVKGSRRET